MPCLPPASLLDFKTNMLYKMEFCAKALFGLDSFGLKHRIWMMLQILLMPLPKTRSQLDAIFSL